MRIRLLGPVMVQSHTGDPVTPTAPKRRALLSSLALELGQVVPTVRLLELVWEGNPPPTARAALQGHIAELRRLLDDRLTLTTRGAGYLLTGDPEQVDALHFERLCAEAEEFGEPGAAVPLLRQALALWRGPALADCGSTLLRETVAPRLTELRLLALQRLAEQLCRLGRGAELADDTGELARAVAADPTREQLAAQLIRCLEQAGRQADALAVHQRAVHHRTVHQQTVQRLATERGAGPSPVLRAAHPSLTPGPALGLTPRPDLGPTIAQLPRRNRRFTGRAAELARLDAAVAPYLAPGSAATSATPVDRCPILVTGPAGVGKTSLVLHWSHQIAPRFPGGQLYADLRGFDETEPRDPAEVLAGFLTALGVAAADLPHTLDARSRRYRELLTDRQLLLVLDNARDYEQLSPLLPSPDSAPVTLITSRNRLGDLLVQDNAVPLALDVLTPDEAVELLGRVLGPQRIAAEPQAAAEIAERCDHLPLALRLAAARLATRPDWALRDLAGEILDEQSRLAALATTGGGSLGVSAALNLTRRALSEPAARFFGYLGLHPGAVIDPHAAAVLGDVPPAEARTLLAQLDAAHLVEETAPGLFARHDLVRLYSAQLAAELTCAQRESAMDRMIGHYLAATAAACAGLGSRSVLPADPQPSADPLPPLGTPGQAIAWFRREERAVRGVVVSAEQYGRPAPAWQLAHQACVLYYNENRSRREWRQTAEAGLRAARACEDPTALVRMHADLAVVMIEQADFAAATDHLDQAIALADVLGDPVLGHHCRTRLANGLVRAGEHARAIPLMTRIVEHARTLADSRLLAQSLNNLANALVRAGAPLHALAHATEAVQLLSAHPDDPKIIIATQTRAEALHALGRHHAALATARQALTLGQSQGNLRFESHSRHFITAVLRALGRATV
ncbi:AfsR/SARP family transcriptional regulator [Kitasatospora azatica]|uniref:AfsR/SARP family transcriptional regulator n=1 Tax=Kitasatospora azatica TaxID=58347 RepID=UPI00068F1355|nr:BTAD domain-containing putative transcriptional regulator [Kitasatospora azatica]